MFTICKCQAAEKPQVCCSRCSVRSKNRWGRLSSVLCALAKEHLTPSLLKLARSQPSVLHRSLLAIDLTSLKCRWRVGSDFLLNEHSYKLSLCPCLVLYLLIQPRNRGSKILVCKRARQTPEKMFLFCVCSRRQQSQIMPCCVATT